jgi:hypothetical protein
VRLERLAPGDVDWAQLDDLPDRVVYQTHEWMNFIADVQGGEPVLARLVDGSTTVGQFTGLVVKRFGFRILGSPMPGWTTGPMGFNLDDGVSRREAVEALVEFAFGPLACAHLELFDHKITLADVDGLGFEHTLWTGLEVDLDRSEDEIWASLKSPCRTAIRKAEKQGVVVEEAADMSFADEYHAQAEDVFAKQSMVPPFNAERLRALIRHVGPSGRLLMLRTLDVEGTCIATGVYPGTRRGAHFLLGASWRDYQHLRPNEALMWDAIKRWKWQGAKAFDLGWALDYKRKWGGHEVETPYLRKSRSRPVAGLRVLGERVLRGRQSIQGRLSRKR